MNKKALIITILIMIAIPVYGVLFVSFEIVQMISLIIGLLVIVFMLGISIYETVEKELRR